MRTQASHGRLKIAVSLCIFIPVLAALTGGFRAASQAAKFPREKLDSIRVEEVNAQARTVAESFWSAADSIRTRTFAIYYLRSKASQGGATLSGVLPEGPVLHWTEFALGADGKLVAKQAARKSGFVPGDDFEASYLARVSKDANLLEIQKRGIGAIRVPPLGNSRAEWLALAFPVEKGILVSLINPMDAFPVFDRWKSHSEGGRLRAYLIGNDGTVLAHSISAYVGSRFDSLGLFKNALKSLFSGERISGAGTYAAIDQLKATSGYVRLGQLDLGIVVEKVVGSEIGGFPWFEFAVGALLSLALALVASMGAGWLIQTRSVSRAPVPELGAKKSTTEKKDQVPKALIQGTPASALVQASSSDDFSKVWDEVSSRPTPSQRPKYDPSIKQ